MTVAGDQPSRTVWSVVLPIVAAAVVGLVAGQLTPALASFSTRRLAIAAAAIVFVLVTLALTRRVQTVLLGSWILSLNYVRWYPLGASETQALHVVSADIFLVLLLVHWIYSILTRQPAVDRGSAWIPLAMLPFLLASLLSAINADRPDWTLIEVSRFVRGFVVVLYVRYQVGPRDWWWSVVFLGSAVSLQSAYGVYQVLFRRVAPAVGESYSRAIGTMIHPAFLAGYLLLLVPIFLCLALAARRTSVGRGFLAVFLTGALGLAATLGRVPLALAAGEFITIGIMAIWLRWASVRQVIASLSGAGLLVVLVTLPVVDRIVGRLTENVGDAVEFRMDLNRRALAMAEEHPLFGIGLNNFSDQFRRETNHLEWAFRIADELALEGIRFIVAVHNYHLLVAIETGIVGTASWILLWTMIIAVGIRSMRNTTGVYQGLCLGGVVGIVGVLAHDLTNYALIAEPVLYSALFLAALIEKAPVVQKWTNQHVSWTGV